MNQLQWDFLASGHLLLLPLYSPCRPCSSGSQLQAQMTQGSGIHRVLAAEVLSSSQLLVFIYNSYTTCSETSSGKEILRSTKPTQQGGGLKEPCPASPSHLERLPSHCSKHQLPLFFLLSSDNSMWDHIRKLRHGGIPFIYSKNAIPLWGRKKDFIFINPNKFRITHWDLVKNFPGLHFYLGNIIGGQSLWSVSITHSPGD